MAQWDDSQADDQQAPGPSAQGGSNDPTFVTGLTALYHKYAHRDPTPAEIQSHAGNPGGLPAIEGMLMSQAGLDATHAGAEQPNAPAPTTPTGRDAILQHIKDFAAAHPNANPSINNDPNYWADRIMQTHPDGNVDWGYWEGRFLTPEGPAEGAGQGGQAASWFDQNQPAAVPQYTNPAQGGGGYSVPQNTSQYAVPARPGAIAQPFTPQMWTDQFASPSMTDLQSSPGFQAEQEAALTGLQRSAAANGSVLSGGFVGKTLPRSLATLAGQQYQQLYNNAYQTYQDRYKAFQDQNTNALNAYAANVGGYNADVGNALQAFNTNQNVYNSNVQNGLQAFNANQNAYQQDVNNNLSQYDRRYQAYQDLIKNNLNLAQLGAGATTAGSPGAAQ